MIADYIVTAALSALSAFQYLGWSYPEVFAAGTILLIGGLNTFGPKHFSGLAFLISVPTVIVVISLGCFVLPHVGEAIRNMQPLHGSWLYNWNGFVSIVLALSGVEAIANATEVMKLNKGSTDDHPFVTHTSNRAIVWVMLESWPQCFSGAPSNQRRQGASFLQRFVELKHRSCGTDLLTTMYF